MKTHTFLLTDFKGHFYIILDVRCFSSIFTFLNTLLCLLFRYIWCFLLNFSVFSLLLLEQYRVTNFRREKMFFFVFSRIRIHGRLTKNHEWFRFSRHIPPASKQFSKSDLYLMPVPSERENHQKTQNFHFFEKNTFFWSLWEKTYRTDNF